MEFPTSPHLQQPIRGCDRILRDRQKSGVSPLTEKGAVKRMRRQLTYEPQKKGFF